MDYGQTDIDMFSSRQIDAEMKTESQTTSANIIDAPGNLLIATAKQLRSYVEKYEASHDERAIFAYAYFLVTSRLASALVNNEYKFESPMWVAQLGVAFSELFFEAMSAIDQNLEFGMQKKAITSLKDKVSQPWVDVYEAIWNHKSYVYEELVYSMMAHISHDLTKALIIVGQEGKGQSHICDFHTMNAVLASDIPLLEKDLAKRYNPFLRLLDKLAGGYDRFLSNYGIRVARGIAWYNACRLRDPSSVTEAEETIASSTKQFIETVRRPQSWSLRYVVRFFRFAIPAFHFWPKPGVGLEAARFLVRKRSEAELTKPRI
jgi:hypothetical protein